MRYELKDKPDFSVVHVAFDQAGEALVVESSSMVARDPGIQMQTSMSGGLGSALKRKLLGGESLFQNTFTATAPGQTIWLAPAPEGDLEVLELNGQMPIFLNSGAFLAAGSGVKLDTQWGGAKGFFSGTGFFLLRADGQGPLFFSAYGGIHAIDVGPGGYICDTGSIVGFTGGLQYQVQKVGGLKSLFFSGEGLVCRFSGQGRLWVSTRSPASLAAFLHPFRRVERSND
ncbi:MAG: TIGR00266 family protein [Polyangiales bacterium]